MKFSLVTLWLFFSSTFYAQYLEIDWGNVFASDAYPTGAMHNGKSVSAVSDHDGNVYVASLFRDTVVLTGVTNPVILISTGQNDGVVAKFNSDGECLWAHKFGGAGQDFCNIINVTSDSSIIIGGGFSGQVDFDPSSNDSICNSTYAPDLFFLKLSIDGEFEWVRTLIGTATSYDCIHGIKENSNQELILTGEFSGTQDFDPGNGNTYVAAGSGFGSPRAIFLAKYNQSGNLVWINKMGGGSPADIPYDLDLDADDNIIIAGIFMSVSMDMDASSDTSLIYNYDSNSYTDAFLAKYDTDGNHLWSGSFGGAFSDEVRNVTVNSDNEILITGQYNGNVDFDLTNNTYFVSSNNTFYGFMSKYLPSGELSWVKLLSPNYLIKGAVFDEGGNIFLGGSFLDTSTIDGQTIITSSSGGDGFISEFSSQGNCLWANSFGGPNGDLVHDLILDQNNNIIIGGGFNTITDIDPSPAVYEFTGESTLSNFFIAKYSLGDLGIDELNSMQSTIYPNPNMGGDLNIQSTYVITSVELVDLCGKKILESTSTPVDVSSIENGEYLLRIHYSNQAVVTHKFIICR